jgi:hypothetical protein
MKKKLNLAYVSPELLPLSKKINFSSISKKRKEVTLPPPPSEETVVRLNEIVKQSPFCFYYREKENDSL